MMFELSRVKIHKKILYTLKKKYFPLIIFKLSFTEIYKRFETLHNKATVSASIQLSSVMFISYGFIPQTSYQPVLSKIWFELSDYSKPLWCYTILNMILIAYFLINILFFLQTSRLKHIFHSKQSTNIALKLNKTNAFMVRTLLVKYNLPLISVLKIVFFCF